MNIAGIILKKLFSIIGDNMKNKGNQNNKSVSKNENSVVIGSLIVYVVWRGFLSVAAIASLFVAFLLA